MRGLGKKEEERSVDHFHLRHRLQTPWLHGAQPVSEDFGTSVQKALREATPEQTLDFAVGPHGVDIWWPQLDEGIYLPNWLEGKNKTDRNNVAA